jgi:hypothetical protein
MAQILLCWQDLHYVRKTGCAGFSINSPQKYIHVLLGTSMETSLALHLTASTRLRITPPKLAPVGRQLRVLAKRYTKGVLPFGPP